MFIEIDGSYPYPIGPREICETIGWKDWHELLITLLHSEVIDKSTFLCILEADDKYMMNPNDAW